MEYDPTKLVGRSTKIINEIDLIPVNSAGVAPTATAPENRTGLSTDNVAQGEPEVNTVAEGIRPSKTGRSFNNAITKLLADAVKKELSGQTAVYYYDKKRAATLLNLARVQFPGNFQQDGYIYYKR